MGRTAIQQHFVLVVTLSIIPLVKVAKVYCTQQQKIDVLPQLGS